MAIAWIDVLKETLLITSFVILVMLIVEYLNVLTKGALSQKIQKNTFLQIVIAAVLGIIPGCMGVFTVVSLYSNGLMCYAALVASMIATTGDEAFFMLAYIPKQTFIIFLILFVLSILVGLLVNKFFKKKYVDINIDTDLDLDKDEVCKKNPTARLSIKNFNCNPKRLILLFLFLTVFVLAFVGVIEHSHGENSVFNLLSSSEGINPNLIMQDECSHVFGDACDNGHTHDHTHANNHSASICQTDNLCHSDVFDWVRNTIAISALFSMIIVIFASDHFVFIHIWQHLLKGHFVKIFLWTFATLLLINILFTYAGIDSWLSENMWLVLLIALLIGIIPESGPHLIFVILFIQGNIPFSILLANSIMQNGHGPLPLLAKSKKSFLIIKIIGFSLGGLIGAAGLIFGF